MSTCRRNEPFDTDSLRSALQHSTSMSVATRPITLASRGCRSASSAVRNCVVPFPCVSPLSLSLHLPLLTCSGSTTISGQETAFPAMADDMTTDEIDGFANGQEMIWIFTTSDNIQYRLFPSPNQNYATNPDLMQKSLQSYK